uniref:Uncharacterized protein n=1 Tax=Fagus sylvatica TaxID=28930 RepID=A0A2N9H9D8_FAGSY
MRVIQHCICRPLHSTLFFSSSSTSTTSSKRLGPVWSRSLSHVTATTIRLFKAPTPPGLQNGVHSKSQGWVMGSKSMFKSISIAIPLAHSSHRHLFFTYSSKPISKIHSFPLHTNGFSSISHADVPRPASLESPAGHILDLAQLKILKQKLEELGMDTDICIPGQYNHLLCPMALVEVGKCGVLCLLVSFGAFGGCGTIILLREWSFPC